MPIINYVVCDFSFKSPLLISNVIHFQIHGFIYTLPPHVLPFSMLIVSFSVKMLWVWYSFICLNLFLFPVLVFRVCQGSTVTFISSREGALIFVLDKTIALVENNERSRAHLSIEPYWPCQPRWCVGGWCPSQITPTFYSLCFVNLYQVEKIPGVVSSICLTLLVITFKFLTYFC